MHTDTSGRVPAGHRAEQITQHELPTQGIQSDPLPPLCSENLALSFRTRKQQEFRKSKYQGKESIQICLRGSSFLLWLSLTCKEKSEGVGTLRKSCLAIVQILRARWGKLKTGGDPKKKSFGKPNGEHKPFYLVLKVQPQSCMTAPCRDTTYMFQLKEVI